jgi:hypothetical protein
LSYVLAILLLPNIFLCVRQDMSQANAAHGLGLLGVVAHVPVDSTEVREDGIAACGFYKKEARLIYIDLFMVCINYDPPLLA